MNKYYQIYRNSYNDFGIYNDSVPYFSMINDRYMTNEEIDEKNMIARLRKLGIDEASYYLHLYSPKRLLEYTHGDIKSFYTFFTNWNDLMSSMFCAQMAKSIPFIKIDKPEITTRPRPEALDKNIVINCKNIVDIIKGMCGTDTDVDPFDICSFFDRDADSLTNFKKDVYLNALETYFIRFLLNFAYAVNEIPDERGEVFNNSKFTYDIFVRYFNEVLAKDPINPLKKVANLYGRLYDTHETITKERPVILQKEDDNRLIAKAEDRSLAIEPYYLKSIVSKTDARLVHFFNIHSILSYMTNDFVESLNLLEKTVMNLTNVADVTELKVYETFKVSVETEAEDYTVELSNNIGKVTKSENEFGVLFEKEGEVDIIVSSKVEGKLENKQRFTLTILPADELGEDETIITVYPESIMMTMGDQPKKIAYLTSGAYLSHSVETIVEDEETVDEKPTVVTVENNDGYLEVTAVSPGNAKIILASSNELVLQDHNTSFEINVVVVSQPEISPDDQGEQEETQVIEEKETVWEDIGSLVTKEQLESAFFFSKRVLDAYIFSNIRTIRENRIVLTPEDFKVIKSGKGKSIFEPYYLYDPDTLKEAEDKTNLWGLNNE